LREPPPEHGQGALTVLERVVQHVLPVAARVARDPRNDEFRRTLGEHLHGLGGHAEVHGLVVGLLVHRSGGEGDIRTRNPGCFGSLAGPLRNACARCWRRHVLERRHDAIYSACTMSRE
jgi:hypothetical protein